MQLLLERGSGLMGGVIFILNARVEFTPEERSNIRRYRLGNTLIYQQYEMTNRGSGLSGVIGRFLFRMRNIQVTVAGLVNGTHLEFKDIHEMLAVEEHLTITIRNFKDVLDAASGYRGENLVELP